MTDFVCEVTGIDFHNIADDETARAEAIKYGMDKVITQLQNGKRTFVLNWPEWIFWSFVPIGAGCMILHFIEFCLDFCCKTDSAKNTDNSTKSNMNTITTDKKEGK